MLTKIEVKADIELDFLKIHTLDNKKTFAVKNKECINLENDWHLLEIEYAGQKNDFTDITINNYSIGNLIYTGYFEDNTGKIFQPATCVFSPGSFKLWFHPNLGYMKGEMWRQIYNGDFGKNLFETYLFTVDRPMEIPSYFPNDIKEFFAHGAGPRWWNKNTDHVPYQVLENNDQIQKFIHPLVDSCKNKLLENDDSKGWQVLNYDHRVAGKHEPLVLSDESFNGTGQYFQSIGWNRIYQLMNTLLEGNGHIQIHIDDKHYEKNKDQLKGLSKFYYAYENHENVYFKMHGVGLVPIDKPLLLNTSMFVHSLINVGEQTKKTLMVYGSA